MAQSTPPSIPYGKHSISEDDIQAVINVLRSDFLTQGPVVPAFEQSVANQVGASHAVAVNSATSALHVACLALGLSKGDRLWTTPITFVASANCARYCGADVDFVDIQPSTGLMCTAALREKLRQAEITNMLPKIVVPVHLAGTSCDMFEINKLADDYGFSIVEDASHAIGGIYQGHKVGSCFKSSICIFSFHPVKIITTGEGGVATTNSSELAQRMKDLRSHGITKDLPRFLESSPSPWHYEQQDLGFNYRMTDIQASLGLSQLKRLDLIVKERNQLFENYRDLLIDLPCDLLTIPQGIISSVHLAIIKLQDVTAEQHETIFRRLRGSGIGVQLHYTPVHLQPYYRALGFSSGLFPESEAYAKCAISLPLFPGLERKEQETIVCILADCLKSIHQS